MLITKEAYIFGGFPFSCKGGGEGEGGLHGKTNHICIIQREAFQGLSLTRLCRSSIAFFPFRYVADETGLEHFSLAVRSGYSFRLSLSFKRCAPGFTNSLPRCEASWLPCSIE
jgi:hypothetical protein